MNNNSPYVRYYYFVQWIIEKNYPSKSDIEKWLEEKEIYLSERTLFRDKKKLIELYNIPIEYCHVHKGYYLDKEVHHETEKFLKLMQELISNSSVTNLFSNNKKYLKYLEFENEHNHFEDTLFEDLLTAAHKKKEIEFTYHSYVKNKVQHYQVKPHFLKQYQNRWYIIAEHSKIYKAFALERIRNLNSTNIGFQSNLEKVKEQYLDIVGLTNDAAQLKKKIVLKFCPSQKNYVKSLPLHKSQRELKDSKEEYTIELYVKPNFELKQQILKYGKLLQVMQPYALQQEIQQEYEQALINYKSKSNE